MAAVNGAILPVMSNVSQTLETQSPLVSFDGIAIGFSWFSSPYPLSKIHIFNV